MPFNSKGIFYCVGPTEPICHVKLESIVKLKESTRKLLTLLEEIQKKTHSKTNVTNEPCLSNIIKPVPMYKDDPSVTSIIGAEALKQLESQTRHLQSIKVEDEEDDCSVYKRLTRKCHCLNQQEYNDFIIHFNEATKFHTSPIGEIIKNMRILKKFLYMGGRYTKNSLLFLNEGLAESSHLEKIEITQACAYADICNVFEDHSVIIICVSWPCKYENYGDSMTQALAANFVYKLSQLEEGRRYLKFSSKITNDIRKVLRKKASKLDFETTETLNATINLMHPPFTQQFNVTYYCKLSDEGPGNKVLTALIQYRQFMILDEVFTHLDLLQNLSNQDSGKTDLQSCLPQLLSLFKNMLIEYDNSEVNIIITNILNKIVSKNLVKEKELSPPSKTVVVANTGTETVKIKHEFSQFPPKKSSKKPNKSKLALTSSSNKYRQPSKRKVNAWEAPQLLNKSKKFTQESRNQIIIVPVDS